MYKRSSTEIGRAMWMSGACRNSGLICRREGLRTTRSNLLGGRAMPRQRADLQFGGEATANEASIDACRQSHRAYMRRWRSEKANRDHERAKRAASYYQRKARPERKKRRKAPARSSQLVCAICRKTRSVRQVARLRVCGTSPSGFEEVLIPYCGQC